MVTSEVIAALVGAMVGAAGTFLLNVVAWEKLQERVRRKRLAAALLADARALRDRYEEVFGKHVRELRPGEPLERIGARVGTQNFFAVYDGSIPNLGLFNADDVAHIARAAVLAKGHVESINQFYEGGMTIIANINQLVGADNLLAAQDLEKKFVTYKIEGGERLKQESQRTLQAFDEAISALTKYT